MTVQMMNVFTGTHELALTIAQCLTILSEQSNLFQSEKILDRKALKGNQLLTLSDLWAFPENLQRHAQSSNQLFMIEMFHFLMSLQNVLPFIFFDILMHKIKVAKSKEAIAASNL